MPSFRGPDRRLRTRSRIRLPFLLKNDGQQVRGITRNLSLLGISAYTEGPLSLVQPVQCLLELPQHPQPTVANGTVIRCETLSEPNPDGPYEMGIFFKEFEGNGESTLARFLEDMTHQEQAAIKAGYRVLQQRIAARRRRKRLELLKKKRRKIERLRKRKQRLAKQKRLQRERRRQKLKRQAARGSARRPKRAR